MIHNIGHSYNGSDPGGFTEINGYLYFYAFYNGKYTLYKLELPDIPVSVQPSPTVTPTFEIYPNPAGEKLIIKNTQGANMNCRILNLRGKEVFSWIIRGETEPSIDISALKPGIYIIIGENHIMQETYKFIKN